MMMDFENIPAKMLENYINKDNIIIIDLRSHEDYLEEHVPKAVNINYEELEKYYNRLKKYNEIILYCDRGGFSLLAARDLSKLGYHAINVYGGFLAYKGEKSTTEYLFID